MLAGWETLDTPNNSLIIELSEDHQRDYYTDTFVRSKQVIYWPTFIAGRSFNKMNSLISLVLHYCCTLLYDLITRSVLHATQIASKVLCFS
jgi:hypothetical protein